MVPNFSLNNKTPKTIVVIGSSVDSTLVVVAPIFKIAICVNIVPKNANIIEIKNMISQPSNFIPLITNLPDTAAKAPKKTEEIKHE